MKARCPHCAAVKDGSWKPVQPTADAPLSDRQRTGFDALAYCWMIHDTCWGDGMPTAHGLQRRDLFVQEAV